MTRVIVNLNDFNEFISSVVQFSKDQHQHNIDLLELIGSMKEILIDFEERIQKLELSENVYTLPKTGSTSGSLH